MCLLNSTKVTCAQDSFTLCRCLYLNRRLDKEIKVTDEPILSLIFTLFLCQSLSLSLTLFHPLVHFFLHSPSHFTRILILTLPLSHVLILLFPLALSPSHCLTLSLSHSHSHSLFHTQFFADLFTQTFSLPQIVSSSKR